MPEPADPNLVAREGATPPAARVPPPPGAKAGELERAIYELRVHQVELEMQNEELRRVQLELAQMRDYYMELFDLAPVGHLVLDREGKVLEANQAAARFVGVAREALVGRHLSAFMGEAAADAFHLHRQAVIAGSRQHNCEIELTAASGRKVPVHIASVARNGEAGCGMTLRSVLIDLTELRESEGRLSQIAHHVADAFVLSDVRQGRILYVSPAFEAITGRSEQALYDAGAKASAWVHPDDRAVVVAEIDRHLASPGGYDLTFRILRPDGEVRWVRARGTAIAGADGRVERDVVVLSDITEHRALQEQLQHAHKMEAIGTLASGVAHDFNNVLQGIIGCTTLAMREGIPVEQMRGYIAAATKVAHRGGQLAAQLLAFSRKEVANARALSIDEVLHGGKNMLERLVTEKIRIELETSAPRCPVLADAVQVEQIVMNLASNARDAMPEGGTLTLGTEEVELLPSEASARGLEAGRYLRLRVSDSGTGMDERTRARIFEPFFTTKAVGKGTGLGLASVFAIVRDLGGHIEVESRPGSGTRFDLLFPCAPPEGIVADPPEEGTATALGRRTVLVVEDELLIRMALVRFLKELGLSVHEAASPLDALELVRTYPGPLDLLITDIVMPDMLGTKLAELLRERHPTLRILFISANPQGVVGEEAPALPEPLLQKPFGEAELVAKVGEILNAP